MRMPACVLRALRGAVAVSASCLAIVCLLGANLNAQDSQSNSQAVPQPSASQSGGRAGMPGAAGAV